MFPCIFLENASTTSSASKCFKCFESPSIDISILLFPWSSNELYQETASLAYFIYSGLFVSFYLNFLQSEDEEEDVIWTDATTNNSSQRKDSVSFTRKGFPLSSAG